jgi:hypothetical protein
LRPLPGASKRHPWHAPTSIVGPSRRPPGRLLRCRASRRSPGHTFGQSRPGQALVCHGPTRFFIWTGGHFGPVPRGTCRSELDGGTRWTSMLPTPSPRPSLSPGVAAEDGGLVLHVTMVGIMGGPRPSLNAQQDGATPAPRSPPRRADDDHRPDRRSGCGQVTAPGAQPDARRIESAWYLSSSPVGNASSGAAVAGGGRARVLHRACGTRGSRPGGVWMAEYVATMAPASSTGGHAAAEQFQHDPGASRSASATIPGARSSPSRASPEGWGYVRALNKAYSLRRGENEDGHARSASGRPPDHSGETREWCAPGAAVAERTAASGVRAGSSHCPPSTAEPAPPHA